MRFWNAFFVVLALVCVAYPVTKGLELWQLSWPSASRHTPVFENSETSVSYRGFNPGGATVEVIELSDLDNYCVTSDRYVRYRTVFCQGDKFLGKAYFVPRPPSVDWYYYWQWHMETDGIYSTAHASDDYVLVWLLLGTLELLGIFLTMVLLTQANRRAVIV